ncbi:hypothetical protein QP794_01775 [Paenibacillus sp. UMB7766-LJ446]|uniref:hypothetical protein n=1 Tax=Paenibacillus sp. UMB7766-LJ446 TaxID=3046313 RepID=UPI00254E6A92|nr:hypothetical protein [Paenibacillus sp. UMB7766-LJ446]MDK8188811.1 hypothetical protein [Paenibacillus sp. UMB7766-LJ446]
MRKCFNCQTELPEVTEHFVIDSETYCTDCVEAYPASYSYFVDGEFVGDSDSIDHVEAFDDEYQEEVGEDI